MDPTQTTESASHSSPAQPPAHEQTALAASSIMQPAPQGGPHAPDGHRQRSGSILMMSSSARHHLMAEQQQQQDMQQHHHQFQHVQIQPQHYQLQQRQQQEQSFVHLHQQYLHDSAHAQHDDQRQQQQHHEERLAAHDSLLQNSAHLQQPTHNAQHLVHGEPHLHQLESSARNLLALDSAQQHQQMQQQQQQSQQAEQEINKGATKSAQTGENGSDSGGPIVQWLLENYEAADGESLPRSTVYNHYLNFCQRHQLSSVNAASFGKLIRSVFLGLKTRRLGTRGHSKYHYFGVRGKPHILQELAQYNEHPPNNELHGSSSSLCVDIAENSSQNTDNATDSDSTGNDFNDSQSRSANKRCKCSDEFVASDNMYGQHPYEHQTEAAQQFPQLYNQMVTHEMHGYNVGQAGPYGQQQHHFADQHFNFEQVQSQPPQQQQQQQQQQHQHMYYYAHVGSASFHNNGPLNGRPETHANSGASDQFSGMPLFGTLECVEVVDDSHMRAHLGTNWATLVDEKWPNEMDNYKFVSMLSKSAIHKDDSTKSIASLWYFFNLTYRQFYKRMLELLYELKFDDIKQLCDEFWHPKSADKHNSAGIYRPRSAQPRPTASTSRSLLAGPTQPRQQSANISTPNATMTGATDALDNLNQQQQEDAIGAQRRSSSASAIKPPPQKPLDQEELHRLFSNSDCIDRLDRIDHAMYAGIELFLLPNLFSPVSRMLMGRIRLFARSLVRWIESAVRGYAAEFVRAKSNSARALACDLRRRASLNQIITASQAVWNNRPLLLQMSIDLNGIDLMDVEHQATNMYEPTSSRDKSTAGMDVDTPRSPSQSSWSSTASSSSFINEPFVELYKMLKDAERARAAAKISSQESQEDDLIMELRQQVQEELREDKYQRRASRNAYSKYTCRMQLGKLHQNFLNLLGQPQPAGDWPAWCRNLVESRVGGESIHEARHFLHGWNFYISLIMKELAISTTKSYASFQLVRLLFDEYLYDLVINKLAETRQITTIQLSSLS